MKVIVPAADRTAGRRSAGRRRTKRIARNPAGAGLHPKQREINRGQIDFLLGVAEWLASGTRRLEKLRVLRHRIPVGRKAFVR